MAISSLITVAKRPCLTPKVCLCGLGCRLSVNVPFSKGTLLGTQMCLLPLHLPMFLLARSTRGSQKRNRGTDGEMMRDDTGLKGVPANIGGAAFSIAVIAARVTQRKSVVLPSNQPSLEKNRAFKPRRPLTRLLDAHREKIEDQFSMNVPNAKRFGCRWHGCTDARTHTHTHTCIHVRAWTHTRSDCTRTRYLRVADIS